MSYSVYISPLTVKRPRYATLAAMDAWCNEHASGRWQHRMVSEYREGITVFNPDYNTYVFEDAGVATLFKLTWWKADV